MSCALLAVSYKCSFPNISFYLFYFKQKTAYEMRISYWSSDVCSSDLQCQYYAYYYVFNATTVNPGSCDDTNTFPVDLYSPGLLNHFYQIGRASCRERVCQYV